MRARTTLSGDFKLRQLLAYIADLELEVDRLRKQSDFIHQETREALRRIIDHCTEKTRAVATPFPSKEIHQAAKDLDGMLRDVAESRGYHPAHDQVNAIAIRPLIEKEFRWQQRLLGAPDAILRLDLEMEHVDWFPARMRHILENLLSNALKYRDAQKKEAWVHVGLRGTPKNYELRLSDNGVGMLPAEGMDVLEVLCRGAPARSVGVGVGLPVVRLLVEQSGGTLTIESDEGQGTSFLVVLPRYDVSDFLE